MISLFCFSILAYFVYRYMKDLVGFTGLCYPYFIIDAARGIQLEKCC